MFEVDEILMDWGFDSLIPVFRENKIDLGVFKKLTPAYIARLIPAVGDQLIFEEQWNKKYATAPSQTLSVSVPVDVSTTPVVNKEISQGKDAIESILTERIDQEQDKGSQSDAFDASDASDDNSSPSHKIATNLIAKKKKRKVISPKEKVETQSEKTDSENEHKVTEKKNKRSRRRITGHSKTRKKRKVLNRIENVETQSDETDSEKEKQATKEKNKRSRCGTIREPTILKSRANVDAISKKSEESCSDSDSDSNFGTELQAHGQRKAFIGQKEFDKRIHEEEYLSVKNILKESTIGKCLLTGYKQKKELTPKLRRILVDIIISASVVDENTVLRHNQFDLLSDEIVALFPSELKGSYYIPPVPKHLSRQDKSECSKGKLVDKYRNKIKQYRLIAGVSKKQKRPTEKTLEVTDDITASILWLKHNGDAAFDNVLDHWNKTSQYRWKKLKESNTSITDHMKEWPILTKAEGHKLIEADFRLICGLEQAVIYTRWVKFFNKVRNIRRVTNTNAIFLESIIDDENATENSKILAQIQLLPYYVPPKGRIRRNRHHWKPSITECQESMIIHVKEAAGIEEARTDRVNKMAEHGLTVQPYMIVVGPTLEEVKDCYVFIDQTRYRFDSPLRAFEICFASFHVLNAEYPRESEHLYVLIQWVVFNFETDWDKKIPYIMDIAKQVKQ